MTAYQKKTLKIGLCYLLLMSLIPCLAAYYSHNTSPKSYYAKWEVTQVFSRVTPINSSRVGVEYTDQNHWNEYHQFWVDSKSVTIGDFIYTKCTWWPSLNDTHCGWATATVTRPNLPTFEEL